MALISCPECGKQVSSVAVKCPFCGYPISDTSDSGFVKIKTPAQIEGVRTKLFKKSYASIYGKDVKWSGELGSMARFKISGPTDIHIDLGRHADFVDTKVYPNTSYKLEFVRKTWTGLAVYDLVEV